MVATTTSVEPLLLTAKQAAECLALSPRKLWSLTAGGDVPCVRIGRALRYSREDFREWIDQLNGCKHLRG
jgi:excisionase family DNA binding protein